MRVTQLRQLIAEVKLKTPKKVGSSSFHMDFKILATGLAIM